jgi:hypothetical protein
MRRGRSEGRKEWEKGCENERRAWNGCGIGKQQRKWKRETRRESVYRSASGERRKRRQRQTQTALSSAACSPGCCAPPPPISWRKQVNRSPHESVESLQLALAPLARSPKTTAATAGWGGTGRKRRRQQPVGRG